MKRLKILSVFARLAEQVAKFDAVVVEIPAEPVEIPAELPAVLEGPSPVHFQKAITGVKRQREEDSFLEFQKFLKSVLGPGYLGV